MKTNKVMAHMVAGFPNLETSFRTAQALIDGGAAYLEVQFPFSDPSADGPVIQAACTTALEAGFKVSQGWDLIKRIKAYKADVPVFIMSYGSIVFTKGVDEFCAQAAAAGASGLIIPDLAPGADEGLYAAAKARGVPSVPVIVPTVSEERLKYILSLKPDYIYTAIRTGITGTHTTLTPSLLDFLGTLAENAKVLAGFGIDSPDQAKKLAPIVHSLVVGSAFVREVEQAATGGAEAVYKAVKAKLETLVQA